MAITITDNAAKRIRHLLQNEQDKNNLRLRITVSGGGCSGFQYGFVLDNAQTSDDKIFSHEDASIIIDEISLGLLDGSTVDFVEDMVKSSFVITNPNAAAKCGCGNSFTI